MTFRTKLEGLSECLRFSNRWSLLLNRALFPANRLHVYRLGRLEFIVDHGAGDPSGTRAALVTPMYRQLLSRCGLSREARLRVLDIGANGGGFSLLLLDLGLQIDRLIAVEMNASTAGRLRFNLSRNLPDNHEVLVGAVTGNGRTIEAVLGEGDTGDSVYRSSSQGRRRSINGLTLDQVAEKLGPGSIDLVKMDIEGAETEVILGDHAQCFRAVTTLIIEIHDASHVTQLAHRLAEHGLEQMWPADYGRPGVFLFSRRLV